MRDAEENGDEKKTSTTAPVKKKKVSTKKLEAALNGDVIDTPAVVNNKSPTLGDQNEADAMTSSVNGEAKKKKKVKKATTTTTAEDDSEIQTTEKVAKRTTNSFKVI